MRTNESAVYTTENKGRFNWRIGENREGHYSDPLNLMWTKTWSMSITWLSKCAMEINITHKKLKIPWGHVSLPHTKGHGYDLSILIEICTVQHKLMHGTWEIYLHEQPTVCSACHSNSVHTLREREKKKEINWFSRMEFFPGLYALDTLYSEYVEYVFQTTEEGKRPNSAVRNIPLFSTSSKCWRKYSNVWFISWTEVQNYKGIQIQSV